LDRKDLKDAAFDIVLRGYDRRQVDERLRLLAAELIAAEKALRNVQERAAMLEDEVNQMHAWSGASSAPEPSFGARVEKILMLAEDEARDVRDKATAESTTMVEQARSEVEEHRRQAAQEIAARRAETERKASEQEAGLQRLSAQLEKAREDLDRESEQVRAQARSEAEQVCAAAAKEADEVRKAGAQEGEEVRKAARGDAAQLVEQARIEADRLVASAAHSAQQRERASAHELQRLSRLRDQVNAELYRAKTVLDGLFQPARDHAGDAGQDPDTDPGKHPDQAKEAKGAREPASGGSNGVVRKDAQPTGTAGQ
jgi:cell division septum initiation protein DivIVA